MVPGRVCTVVPASGSRSSLLPLASKSELEAWRQAYRSRTRRMAGTPYELRWAGGHAPSSGLAPRAAVPARAGSRLWHPDILRTREQLNPLTSRTDGRPTPREHRPPRHITRAMKDRAAQLHTQ